MSLHSQLQASATEAQRVITEMMGMAAGGTNATLAGVALVVTPDLSRRGEELMIGGRIVTLALTGTATRDQSIFSTVTPAAGMAFVFDGQTYKVLSTGKDALHWFLTVGHPSQ